MASQSDFAAVFTVWIEPDQNSLHYVPPLYPFVLFQALFCRAALGPDFDNPTKLHLLVVQQPRTYHKQDRDRYIRWCLHPCEVQQKCFQLSITLFIACWSNEVSFSWSLVATVCHIPSFWGLVAQWQGHWIVWNGKILRAKVPKDWVFWKCCTIYHTALKGMGAPMP